jgi:hypothetical protein
MPYDGSTDFLSSYSILTKFPGMSTVICPLNYLQKKADTIGMMTVIFPIKYRQIER